MTRTELERHLATAVHVREQGLGLTPSVELLVELYAALLAFERMARSKLDADVGRRTATSLSSRVRVFAEEHGYWNAGKLLRFELRQQMRLKFKATPQQISNCLKRIEHAELGK